MQPWLKFDRLRRRHFFNGNCPCCDETEEVTTGGCMGCCDNGDPIPRYYEITMSGWTDGTSCTDGSCSVLNGTFTLEWNSSTCAWGLLVNPSSGCLTEYSIEYYLLSTRSEVLITTNSSFASQGQYTYTNEDVDCGFADPCSPPDTDTLSVSSTSPQQCSGHPSSVTVDVV